MLGGLLIDVQVPHWWTLDPHAQRIAISSSSSRAEQCWHNKLTSDYHRWVNVRDRYELLPGTVTTGGSPHPLLHGRQTWKHVLPPQGHIGLILESVPQLAASVDLSESKIYNYGHPSIDIVNTPLQLYKHFFLDVAFGAVHKASSSTRTALHDVCSVDV